MRSIRDLRNIDGLIKLVGLIDLPHRRLIFLHLHITWVTTPVHYMLKPLRKLWRKMEQLWERKKKDVMFREKQMSVNKFLRLHLLLIPQRLEISSLEIWQFWCAFHWRSCLVESRTTCALKVLFDHPIFHTSKEKLTTNNQYS